MPEYVAPLRDIQFVMYELLKGESHFASLQGDELLSRDLLDAIFKEGAKFCEEVISPLNEIGDRQGCTWSEDGVATPEGFKEAYKQYIEGGWPALADDIEVGGQGLPQSVATVVHEMVGSANWSWGMYPGLSHGAKATIETHGSEEQKSKYLEKLVSGEWTGTMCLTEPHCGTDLGLLRTKATPNKDGSYSISGTKIFISAGEHDMAENIVHIVLARLPDAPEGTKGISLFIVPKILTNENGGLGDPNSVKCGSIEHKMGIHGNSTCVMNFDNAKGWLIGPENKGLNCMFTFMNFARLCTAIQGLGASELSYQGALRYAKERLAMRSLTGVKNKQGPADPIIVHPDVRRMLLTQKAFSEGGRAMLYFTAQFEDIIQHSKDQEARDQAHGMMGFMTPILKAFLTEIGYEAANLGVQVYGGHGFIKEWGMEQIVRDTRIALLYEGTTGVQALDLLGRKILLSQGSSLKQFTKLIHTFCKTYEERSDLKEFVSPLVKLNKEWGDITMKIGMSSMNNRDEVGAASVDYLMYAGYVCMGFLWARMAQTASDALAQGTTEEAFYRSKIHTARFYFKRILPRTLSHAANIQGGADCLMALDEKDFVF